MKESTIKEFREKFVVSGGYVNHEKTEEIQDFLIHKLNEAEKRGEKKFTATYTLNGGNQITTYSDGLKDKIASEARQDLISELIKEVIEVTPKHITREYRDTDKMRDDIIQLLNSKL